MEQCSYLTNTVYVGAFAECQSRLASWLILAGCMPTAPVSFESFLDTIDCQSLSTAVYACGFRFWFAIHLFAAEFSSSRQHPNLRHPWSARSFVHSVIINPAPRDFLRPCSIQVCRVRSLFQQCQIWISWILPVRPCLSVSESSGWMPFQLLNPVRLPTPVIRSTLILVTSDLPKGANYYVDYVSFGSVNQITVVQFHASGQRPLSNVLSKVWTSLTHTSVLSDPLRIAHSHYVSATSCQRYLMLAYNTPPFWFSLNSLST